MTYAKEQARVGIADLVALFRQNKTALLDAPEAMIENNYIRPLFRYLNWNVDNLGLSEPQWEFVLQRTDRKGNRPDYIVQLDGQQLFVMDAKKVKYEMRDPRWLNQVYAYAYSTQNNAPSKKMDFAILTDFQEFVVLDCTLFAAKPEAVNNFRVLDWRYGDYVERFDELWDLIERNNVLAALRERTTGLWARYLSPKKVKANRIPPDKAFLSALDDEKTGWRVRLAKDMKKQNASLDGAVLTAAVQLLIDRLIFVKVLSDREIEDDYLAKLDGILAKVSEPSQGSGTDWFAACKNLFAELNTMYNGSVFAPRPELEAVAVSNAVVRDIISDLLTENSPYNFAVLPVEILGTIYERFLGRVVHATDARVKIEDKPEVRKAGGVYYTPQYIVNYIVAHTIGKLLADCKTPADVARLRILDPACGSGSFLLGAYNALIEWHRSYYVGRGNSAWSPDAGQPHRVAPTKHDRDAYYRDADGRVRLTAKLKRQILLNNIFGVDIDPQAVEVTRLSLSLKALEDTRSDEAHQERTLFNQTLLPDLSANIQCGNSLIGMDYLVTSDEELRRVKPFDWVRAFPQVFGADARPEGFLETLRVSDADARGFDAVIGNPPYVRMESFVGLKEYLRSHFQSHSDRADIFFYFVEQGVSLLRQNGNLGLILSNSFTRSRSGQSLRSFLERTLNLAQVVEFGDFTPFEGASVYPIIIIGDKAKIKSPNVSFVLQESDPTVSSRQDSFAVARIIPQESLNTEAWVFDQLDFKQLRNKLLSQYPSLREEYGEVGMGIKTGFNSAFIIDEETRHKIIKKTPVATGILRPYLGGKNLDRYIYNWEGEWLIYTPHGIDMSSYPAVLEYMKPFKVQLQNRATNQEWYELQQPQEAYAESFGKSKIIFPDMSRYPKFCLDTQGMHFSNTVYFIASDSRYLLGILNSKLTWFVIRGLSNALRGGLWRFRLFAGHIERLPIRTINFSDADDKARHDRVVALVEQMLDLHKRLHAAITETDRALYASQVDATDKQIDALVYQLYDLSAEEIAIVEGRIE